jgi:hypothetical protein
MKIFKIVNLIIYLLILISSSCNEKKTNNFSGLIIGTWTRIIDLENEAPPPGFNEITYEFLGDSAVYYPGLYKIISKTNEFSYRKFIGNKLKYEISKDTLILFFPDIHINSENLKPVKYKIIKIDNDSLFLKSDDIVYKYNKVLY